MNEAKAESSESSLPMCPLHIIIVGVGDANFFAMKRLNSDNHTLSLGQEVT